YCWGWGGYSWRGDGETYTNRLTPTQVNTGALTLHGIVVGWRNICGVDAQGQAYCWGDNGSGQLGTGNNTFATTPQATNTALHFTQLTAGQDHTCGVTTNHEVACWGFNGSGQVGNGNNTNQ